MGTSTAAEPKTNGSAKQATGLFPVAYRIGNGMPGSVNFNVHLMVYTPGERVSGYGTITQATNPPLDVPTKLEGSFSYMTVMPKDTHILVVATGYTVEPGTQQEINVELRMVLTDDWKSGVANYQYRDNSGHWHKVSDAPVKMV